MDAWHSIATFVNSASFDPEILEIPENGCEPIVQLETTEIRVRGKDTNVPSIRVNKCTVIATGRLIRTAAIFDEELVELASLPESLPLIQEVRQSPLKADILTFTQRPFGRETIYDYPKVTDNWAIVSTTSFQHWWDKLPQESRKNARIAEKRGVVTRTVVFDDSFVQGIKQIYDESPNRQGRKFWHYGKSLESVKKENATYPDRSHFVGAYFGDRLIGFIKFVRVDNIAILIQILATSEHRDKKPMNALLKHTMELCEKTGISTLTYGKYSYGTNQDSSLAEFKRRNGFEEIRFPRYFVPLTIWGKAAISVGLHLGVRNMIPKPVTTFLVSARGKILKLNSHPSPKKAVKAIPPSE